MRVEYLRRIILNAVQGLAYGYEADMWAFGILIFEMLMGMCAEQSCQWCMIRAPSGQFAPYMEILCTYIFYLYVTSFSRNLSTWNLADGLTTISKVD